MRLLARLVFVCACCCFTPAQVARLQFDVASVKVSPALATFTSLDRGGPESDTPGSWSCEFYSVRNLLSKAFGLDASQISGPSWMDNERFHIYAKLPPASTREQFREMLRNLLIERFALNAQVESRIALRYELTGSASAPKLLRKSTERLSSVQQDGKTSRPALDADGFPKLSAPPGEPEILTIQGRTRMFFPNSTMKDLADELSEKLGKPVTDATGLRGEYDIGLHWSDDDAGPSLTQALRDQMGLRLVEKRGPVDFVVVRHIEKLPTGN
jgi:uncharacterized protein (TIGR03435 family)